MADLRIEERAGLGLASIMARNGVAAIAIAERIGTALPEGPRATAGNGLTLLGTGPGTWLAIAPAPEWAEGVRASLAGLASVSDQTGGYIVLHIDGSDATRLLRRGAAIDFDDAVFAPGAVAATVISHIGVILHRRGDGAGYDLIVFRSFADSLRHWIEEASAAL